MIALIKKIVGWPFVWACYGVGHTISIVMLKTDWTVLYGPYNAFMCWSHMIQDWAGLGSPWKAPMDMDRAVDEICEALGLEDDR